MGVAARSLLVQLLLPLAAVCPTVPLRLSIASGRLLLLRAPLSARMRILLALGMRCYRGRLTDLRLPTLVVQLGRQLSQIRAKRFS